MKFCNTVIIVLLIFDPFNVLAEIRLHPPWIQVIQHVNENYSVKCEGNGDKVWRNPAGQPITTGTSITTKKSSDNVLYLKFNKIQKEHKGFYNCSATIGGKRYSKGFELIVIKPVSFANTTTEVFVNEGNDVILDCLPDGEPTPEVSWFFEDKLITEWSPSSNYRTVQGVSLKISNASWRDFGTYTCRAFQKILQTRDAEQVYHLKVRHKPYAEEEDVIVYGFRNEYRNITCRVMAYPTAYFIWYRNNVPIDPKIHHLKIYNDENVSQMEISLHDLNSLGRYDCEAANALGMQIVKIDVRLTDRPEIPKLLVHELQHTYVVISVQPYPSYEFICKMEYTEYTYCSYEEKWKKAKVKYCKEKRIPDTNKTHCTIDNLKPLTKYAVRAEIQNDGGAGGVSDELLFKTKKESSIIILSSSAIKQIKSSSLYFVFSIVLFM